MRNRCCSFLLYLSIVVLWTAVSAVAQTANDPWLIAACGNGGTINAHTTREDLVRIFGASNVVDQDVADGQEATLGTVVFPKDKHRYIEILWRDIDTKSAPLSVAISGTTSRWHAVHGISVGTSIAELDRLNGRPFLITGYGTDEPGGVNWQHGALEKELMGCGQVALILDYTSPAKMPEAQDKKVDPFNTNSRDPVLRDFHFRVSRIIWWFPV